MLLRTSTRSADYRRDQRFWGLEGPRERAPVARDMAIKPGIFSGAGVNRSIDETRNGHMWYGGRRFEFEHRRRRQVGGVGMSEKYKFPLKIPVSWG